MLPFASCTIKLAAARSQSRLWPPAKAASRLPCATRHSRSASEPIRGCSAISSGRRVEPLDQRLRTGHAGKIQLGARRSHEPAHRCSVAPCPRMAKKNSSLDRREHRRQHRRRVLDQRHADAPVLAAGKIAAGAVDRIDDPDQPLAETRFVVGAFFRQPAIIRRRRAQPLSRRSLTAMSASDTGDDAPLVQFFSSVRNSDSASAPASRTRIRQQRGVARQDHRRARARR